jgi:hypothetical protein
VIAAFNIDDPALAETLVARM